MTTENIIMSEQKLFLNKINAVKLTTEHPMLILLNQEGSITNVEAKLMFQKNTKNIIKKSPL